jgi:hypothetical protein
LIVGTNDTVEKGEHDEEEWQNVRDDSKGWRKSADPLTPGGLEEELHFISIIFID